jgi:ABC-type branched-subunit amino acid transport system ATPase component
MAILETESLPRRFGDLTAVNRLPIAVGAGQTTTIRTRTRSHN